MLPWKIFCTEGQWSYLAPRKWIVHSLYSTLNVVEIHKDTEITAGKMYLQLNRKATQMMERLKSLLRVQLAPLAQ